MFSSINNATGLEAATPRTSMFDFLKTRDGEPLRAHRIAIMRGNYEDALAHVDQANEHVNDLNVYRRSLGPFARAVPKMLHGTALLGLDRRSEEGVRLINEALAVPRKIAEQVNQADAESLTRRFEPWRRLAERAGR